MSFGKLLRRREKKKRNKSNVHRAAVAVVGLAAVDAFPCDVNASSSTCCVLRRASIDETKINDVASTLERKEKQNQIQQQMSTYPSANAILVLVCCHREASARLYFASPVSIAVVQCGDLGMKEGKRQERKKEQQFKLQTAGNSDILFSQRHLGAGFASSRGVGATVVIVLCLFRFVVV